MRPRVLSARHLDALTELGDAGMASAAAALSQMLGETFAACATRAELIDADRLPEVLGGFVVLMEIGGGGGGEIHVAFPRPDAERLLSRLLRQEEGELLRKELGLSAMKEVANILACAYVNALSERTGMTLTPSAPLVAPCTEGDDGRGVPLPKARPAGEVLALQTEIFTENGRSEPIRGHFFFFPEAIFLEPLLRSAGHL